MALRLLLSLDLDDLAHPENQSVPHHLVKLALLDGEAAFGNLVTYSVAQEW